MNAYDLLHASHRKGELQRSNTCVCFQASLYKGGPESAVLVLNNLLPFYIRKRGKGCLLTTVLSLFFFFVSYLFNSIQPLAFEEEKV